MLEKIYKEKIRSTKKEDIIDCIAIKTEFNDISVKPDVFNESVCNQLAFIQEAVTKNDPLICDKIMQTIPEEEKDNNSSLYKNTMEKHASCIVHFFGSQTWQRGCDEFSEYIDYTSMASCYYDRVIVPSYNHPPYFWFQ